MGESDRGWWEGKKGAKITNRKHGRARYGHTEGEREKGAERDKDEG